MFDWFVQHQKEESLFIDSNDAQTLRVRRVWEFMVVLKLTWIFFAVFLWFRGYISASLICVADALVHVVIMFCFRRKNNYRLIMNLNLAVSAVGLFLVSASHPAMAVTILFYPVAILVASQLLGVYSAFYWLIINIFAFSLFHFYSYGLTTSASSSRFDELILHIGVAVCTFFCCQRGEEFYSLRTKNLISLSQKLRKKSERLHELATTDSLTGVMNRFQFQERLRDAVDRVQNEDVNIALFLLDMDGFKEINDTLGHGVGDDALVEIASRLTTVFGDHAEIARLGGDEFCIIYPGVARAEEAEKISEDICKLLSERYLLRDAEFFLGVSLGVAMSPADSISDRDLLAFADTAMFYAKENRLGYATYEPAMTERLIENRTLQELLSDALNQDEFFIVYQPQVDMRSNQVCGVEALLRWQHNGKFVSPERFIKSLEESGEIIRVTRWIIREACRQLEIWNREGFDIRVSINLSPVQFNDTNFCQFVESTLNEFNIDASRIDFEITERMLVDSVEKTIEVLHTIKQMGVTVSIDDFGTGYSSLAYLKQFPCDRIKIDRAFVKDIPNNDDGKIVASVIILAKAFDMEVLAEGVETEAQRDFLKAYDCDQYQGYYLSPAVSAGEVSKFFAPSKCFASN